MSSGATSQFYLDDGETGEIASPPWNAFGRMQPAVLSQSVGGPSDAEEMAELGSTTVTPYSLFANWERLRTSKLPERTFTELAKLCTSRRPQTASSDHSYEAGALSTFLDIWNRVRDTAAEPVVSLTAKGDIVAEWFSEADHSLAIVSNGHGLVLFSLFDDDTRLEGRLSLQDFERMLPDLTQRDANPFSWTDADEGQ